MMRLLGMENFLKRLELQGFKSFAAKTVFEFPAKVTAIIGPNGSGKSNVVDALRWVLGEREAKQLRGEVLENLIFSGSAKKAAVSLGKVSIYLDNKEGIFPGGSEEVVISRRIDRSGVSQFFLNGSETKLKDLVGFLAKARISSRGLLIINQGESDIFIKSGSQERRLMIEEVLGLKELRFKKNQAQKKLAASEINFDKVKTVIKELTPHLRFLRKQKNRFSKRSEINSILSELEKKYFSFRYHQINKSLEKLEEPINSLEKEISKKKEEVLFFQNNLEEIDRKTNEVSEVKDLRKEINQLIDQRHDLEKGLARLEAEIEFKADKDLETKDKEVVIGLFKSIYLEMKEMNSVNDLVQIKKILKEWLDRLGLYFGKEHLLSDNLLKKKEAVLKELAGLEEELKKRQALEDKILSEQVETTKQLSLIIKKLEEEKNKLRDFEKKREEYRFEKERFNLRMEDLKNQWVVLGYDFNDLKTISPPENIITEEAEKKILRLRGELATIGEIDENLIKEAESTEERHSLLSRELKDLEKASIDLKNLIKDLEKRLHLDFKKGFQAVNEEFDKYFHLVFGGGRAKLKLKESVIKDNINGEAIDGENGTDKDDFTTGVEIEVNLPRKKITSLEMLSGGERSLVSLAVLFALISVNPPPFLIFDEIDAALDEQNASCFSNLIREFSKKNQFILITHNRTTIEVADVLYGITMAEDGASRVLSLRLES